MKSSIFPCKQLGVGLVPLRGDPLPTVKSINEILSEKKKVFVFSFSLSIWVHIEFVFVVNVQIERLYDAKSSD